MNVKTLILKTILTAQLPVLVLLTFPLPFLNYRHMKANPGKCHLLLITKSPEVVSIDGIQITSNIGITIES